LKWIDARMLGGAGARNKTLECQFTRAFAKEV
jgi:hypothetical protein